MLEQNISLWQRLAGWRPGLGRTITNQTSDSDFWVWITATSLSGNDLLADSLPRPPRWPAMVQNISRGGINLLVHHAVQPGTLLKVEAEKECFSLAQFLWVRVIHAVPEGDGAVILGCVFPLELSDEELEAFGGRRLKPNLQDFRAWIRFPCDAEATYKPSPASEPSEWQAQVINVSPSGIGLVVSRQFQPGTILNIALPIASDHLFRTVLACVVHVTPQRGNKWALGCRFATELNDEDLQTFGISRVKSNSEDCRTWVRCPSGMEMSYTSIESGEDQPWSAKILNISANGISLIVSRPLEPGALLSVRLHRPGDTGYETVLACVVYVKEIGASEWMLGCTFASDLSLDD
jgi:hypothetical protein